MGMEYFIEKAEAALSAKSLALHNMLAETLSYNISVNTNRLYKAETRLVAMVSLPVHHSRVASPC